MHSEGSNTFDSQEFPDWNILVTNFDFLNNYNMKHFEYQQPTRIVFGIGSIAQAGTIANEFGTRCLLVTTPAIPATVVHYNRVKEILRSSGMEVAHFDQVIPNPTTETSAAGARYGTRA